MLGFAGRRGTLEERDEERLRVTEGRGAERLGADLRTVEELERGVTRLRLLEGARTDPPEERLGDVHRRELDEDSREGLTRLRAVEGGLTVERLEGRGEVQRRVSLRGGPVVRCGVNLLLLEEVSGGRFTVELGGRDGEVQRRVLPLLAGGRVVAGGRAGVTCPAGGRSGRFRTPGSLFRGGDVDRQRELPEEEPSPRLTAGGVDSLLGLLSRQPSVRPGLGEEEFRGTGTT